MEGRRAEALLVVRIHLSEGGASYLRLAAVRPAVGAQVITPDGTGTIRAHIVRAVGDAAGDEVVAVRLGHGFPCSTAWLAKYNEGALRLLNAHASAATDPDR